MNTLKKRMQSEEGWVVVTAVVITSLMVGIGLAIFSTVGTQQSMSRQERNRESAFNLAESALYAQAFILSKGWPTSGTDYTCTQTTTGDARCPTFSAIQSALDSSNLPDLRTGMQWTIRVRDNNGGTDWDSTTSSNASYDADGDHRLWVRADGSAQGKERSLVALLQLEQFPEPFPQNVITAGHFKTDNQGAKSLVNTGDSQVVLHCSSSDGSCADYDPDKEQVDPPNVTYQPPPGGGTIPTAMTVSELARFQTTAQTNGTYFNSCPTSLAGSVVFIDFQPSYSASNQCTYTGTDTWNSAAAPGLVIIRNGILNLGGDTTFHGLIYAPNPSCSSDFLVTTQGNTHIYGGVAIDCAGGLDVGESHENVTFDGNVFPPLKTTGAAGLVQNTWRELPPKTP